MKPPNRPPAVLSKERPADWPVAMAQLALSRHKSPVDCPTYFAAMKKGLWQDPPPFSTQLYSEMYHAASADGQWMAIALMTNAERAASDSKHLWRLASCSGSQKERQLLKRYAIVKSSHVLSYLALLDLVFPGAVDPDLRSALNDLSPGYSISQRLSGMNGSPEQRTAAIGDFMEMNMAEIRSAVHLLIQRPALAAHCPRKNRPRTNKIIHSLLQDAFNHIADTAMYIESKAKKANRDGIQTCFCESIRRFNRSTSEDPIDYSYNLRFGNYP